MCFVDASTKPVKKINLPKTEIGQKAFTQVEVLLDSALVAAVHRPRDVRTCPGTRAQEGRSERRAVLSRAHEAEQRDGQVRFSVRPCLPELGLGIRACHSTSAICSCGIPGLERAVCRVSLFHRHDHTSHFDVAINGLSCVAGRSSYQGIKATSRNRGCDVGPLGAQDQR